MRILAVSKGRLRAAFLFAFLPWVVLSISGCTAMGNALLAPFEQWLVSADSADAASSSDVPVIRFDLGNGRVGMFQLYRYRDGQAFWTIGSGETVVLRNGMLESMAASGPSLAMTVSSDRAAAAGGSAGGYQLLRGWTDANGVYQTGRARASIDCDAETTTLAVGDEQRRVRRCVEAAAWETGERTRSTYWRDVSSNEVLKARVVPWPGAPRMGWQVIRPLVSSS